jgi:hypothetical protein
MLVTQHVSDIIMPIIRSTRRDDKPHTVFCTGRAAVGLRRWGGSRVHLMAMVIRWCLKHVEWLITSINFNWTASSWFFLLLYMITFCPEVYGIIILRVKRCGGNKLWGCQLDFRENSVQWQLTVFQRCGAVPNSHPWLMVPVPCISLTSVDFLGHSENTVITQYFKIGPDRISSSLSEVPSYFWS